MKNYINKWFDLKECQEFQTWELNAILGCLVQNAERKGSLETILSKKKRHSSFVQKYCGIGSKNQDTKFIPMIYKLILNPRADLHIKIDVWQEL